MPLVEVNNNTCRFVPHSLNLDSVAEAPPSPASKDEIAGDGAINEIKGN
jgi:hypothetical protein